MLIYICFLYLCTYTHMYIYILYLCPNPPPSFITPTTTPLPSCHPCNYLLFQSLGRFTKTELVRTHPTKKLPKKKKNKWKLHSIPFKIIWPLVTLPIWLKFSLSGLNPPHSIIYIDKFWLRRFIPILISQIWISGWAVHSESPFLRIGTKPALS